MKPPSFKLVAAVALTLAGAAGARAQALSIRTLAGNTTPGATNGFGSNARFNHPDGVAADNAGNIYVADTENSTVRKISPGWLREHLGRVGRRLWECRRGWR